MWTQYKFPLFDNDRKNWQASEHEWFFHATAQQIFSIIVSA